VQEPEFLTWEIVAELHEDSLRKFGGSSGVRDKGMVESALGSAQNTWFYGGGDLFDVAASYAFHIAEAQAFLDGNKRTAAAAAHTFLAGNGLPIHGGDIEIFEAMIAIAEKRLDKKGLAEVFRKLANRPIEILS